MRLQLALAAGWLLLAACPKQQTLPPPATAEAAIQLALGQLDAEQYQLAEESFTFVIFNFPGSRQAADAQYHLAETFFRREDWTQAQTEFDFYLKSFPNGRFQEEATYRLALSYFRSAPARSRDQTSSRKAKEMLEEFRVLFPESKLRSEVERTINAIENRLAERDFDIARLYFTAGEYRAALVYFELINERLASSRWQPIDRFRIGVCYDELGRAEEAQAVFQDLLDSDCPDDLKRRARGRLERGS